MFEPFCWYLLILVTATVKDYVSKYLQTRATVLKYWKGQRWTAHRMSKEPNSAGIARNFVFHSSFEHLGKVKFGRCHWYHSNICFFKLLKYFYSFECPFCCRWIFVSTNLLEVSTPFGFPMTKVIWKSKSWRSWAMLDSNLESVRDDWTIEGQMWSEMKWTEWLSMTARWWFQILFIFTPIWGRFPFWLIFSDGLKPPTRQEWIKLEKLHLNKLDWNLSRCKNARPLVYLGMQCLKCLGW